MAGTGKSWRWALSLLLIAGIAASQEDAPPALLEESVGTNAAVAVEVSGAAADVLAAPDGWCRVWHELALRGLSPSSDALAAAVECGIRAIDPGARVMSTEGLGDFLAARSGRFPCLPLTLTVSNGFAVVVESTGEAAPLLQRGDRILEVGGRPLASATIQQAHSALRGPVGPVTVVYQRSDSVATVTLQRTRSPLSAVYLEERWPREIGYLRLNGLYRGAAETVIGRIRQWEQERLSGVILDLRGADGDDPDAAAEAASLFASPGSKLFSIEKRDGTEVFSRTAAGHARAIRIPVMVLIDNNTAGAAEVFAAASAGQRGLLLIGQPTAGDPLIRETVPITGDMALYVAVRRLKTGSNQVFDGRLGVVPDLLVSEGLGTRTEMPTGEVQRPRRPPDAEEVALRSRTAGDEALRRALDVLLGLKALNIAPAEG